jgi:hypothetical protein
MDLFAKTTAAALVAAAAVAAPASAQVGAPIATELRAFTVAAHDTTAAWSSFDEATGQFRLVAREDGAVRQLPVAPSPEPFDVDLGTSRTGSLLAVYTREVEGTRDVFRFNFRTGREERLTQISSPTNDESQPTVHRGTIAFVRRQRERDVLRSAASVRRGARTRAIVSAPAGRGVGGITDPQLAAGRIAYVVQDRPNEFGRRSIHLRTLRTGADRTIYQARSGGANFANVTRPSFSADGAELYWTRTNQGSGVGNRHVRYRVADRELAFERGRSDVISSAWGGEGTGMYAVLGSFDTTDVSRLVATGDLTFDDRP